MYRRLAAANEPDLASSINNLALCLAVLARRDEANSAESEAFRLSPNRCRVSQTCFWDGRTTAAGTTPIFSGKWRRSVCAACRPRRVVFGDGS